MNGTDDPDRVPGEPVPAPPKEILDIYMGMAAIGARALPEEIDAGLLHAWIATTRGESFEIPKDGDTFSQSYTSFWAWMKYAKETVERQGGIDLSDGDFQRLLVYALMQHDWLSLGQACGVVLDSITAGHAELAPEDELRRTYVAAKGRICDWLAELEIKFHSEPSVILPVIVLLGLLEAFAKRPDVFFYPEIPERKLRNALETCGLPESDSAVMLIDCTIFGAADEAIIFGTRGMYYNDGTRAGYVPYSDFPKRTFNIVHGKDTQLSLGGGEILDIAGSNACVGDVLGIVETLKQEASARQRRMRRREGLPEEPRIGESIGLTVRGDDGSVLRFETQATAGHGRIVPLGSMEPVMRESIEAAAQYVRGNYRDLQIEETWADKYDVAVLAPGIAEPKDGPSAGVAIVAGIVSALTSRAVRNDVAMTGEITLKGRVLPIGGLDIKVRAAYEAGVGEVLFPAGNLAEVKSIPHYIRDVVRLTPISTVEELLRSALV
jgi:hypothetical protein